MLRYATTSPDVKIHHNFQEKLWCILMSEEVVVYLNVRRGCGVS
jgi:hypothetical protein